VAAIRKENAEGRAWAEVTMDDVDGRWIVPDAVALVTYLAMARWNYESAASGAISAALCIFGGKTRGRSAFSSRRLLSVGSGRIHWLRQPQPAAFFTSAAIRSSSAAVSFVKNQALGHMLPSSRLAAWSNPNVAYRSLYFEAALKKQMTLPSLA
jgi:hypothetical protein